VRLLLRLSGVTKSHKIIETQRNPHMRFKNILIAAAVASTALVSTSYGQSQQEAADKAYQMASKYAAMGYYITPSKEGRAGFATTLEFTMPVNMGLDYIFIIGGDKYTQDLDIWIESETGNTIVKDTRPIQNGMAGVSWRSDYNGTVNVVVHFARVSSRTAWAALAGRRGNLAFPDKGVSPGYTTQPTSPIDANGGQGAAPADTATKPE
jgi:hypothetical protein